MCLCVHTVSNMTPSVNTYLWIHIQVSHGLLSPAYDIINFRLSFSELETPKNFGAPRTDMTDTSFVVRWDPVPLAEKYIVKAVNERRNADMARYYPIHAFDIMNVYDYNSH